MGQKRERERDEEHTSFARSEFLLPWQQRNRTNTCEDLGPTNVAEILFEVDYSSPLHAYP